MPGTSMFVTADPGADYYPFPGLGFLTFKAFLVCYSLLFVVPPPCPPVLLPAHFCVKTDTCGLVFTQMQI